MCGRYTLRNPEQVGDELTLLRLESAEVRRLPRRYNVAPTQTLPVVTRTGNDLAVRFQPWGFARAFGDTTAPLINARSETVLEKRTFSRAVQEARCLVPADGYFEWQRSTAAKTPYFIRLQNDGAFFMAGICDERDHFALLTTAPNALTAQIHDRMPVILDREAALQWMTPGALAPKDVAALCVSYDPARMQLSPVSHAVNSARNDSPACLAPPEPPPVDDQLSLFS